MTTPEHITRICWCGALPREQYSDRYFVCENCGTLVSIVPPPCDIEKVNDEEKDFYGKNYHLKYTVEKYGFPTIESRARAELPERCLYWLRTLLRYKLPPARVLELGSSHGGFTAMMRWAGYDATGLELSRWMANFAEEVFGVSMLVGPVENQGLEPGTFDIIVMMDVLEHLADPLKTLQLCRDLLRSDGLLLIQTPCYPENTSYDQLVQGCHAFQKMLIDEHFYLFSERSVHRLMNTVGMTDVRFEKAIFSEYDMFIVAGKTALAVRESTEISGALSSNPGSRLILAMLDLDDSRRTLAEALNDCEGDRAARLEVIHRQEQTFSERLRASEADRAARLEVIRQQGEVISQMEMMQRDLVRELDEIKNSKAWKMTEPLRQLGRRVSDSDEKSGEDIQ